MFINQTKNAANLNIKKCQKNFKTIPDLLFRDDVNAGPTALDGLLVFLHFKIIENAPTKTSKSTKEDKAMMIMVLRFIFWFLLTKLALTGRIPSTLWLGLLPVKDPYGGDDGIPNTNSFSLR